jgi:hypothetical protein
MISSVDMDAQVDLGGLTSVERNLLRLGVMEWARSDGNRDVAARLLDYNDHSALRSDVERLYSLIDVGSPISRQDCRRVLLATELAFASETLGWSRDWSADTGFADRDTISVLRTIQEKVAGIVHGSYDRVAPLDAQAPPAWSPISMDVDDQYWTPFRQRFDFRPSMHHEPAITEPVPSVTVDLGPIFAARSHPEFAAGVNPSTASRCSRWSAPSNQVPALSCWTGSTRRTGSGPTGSPASPIRSGRRT